MREREEKNQNYENKRKNFSLESIKMFRELIGEFGNELKFIFCLLEINLL